MSPAVIQVSLLSGRYHAHVWAEAQHAMGGPEWPPSPWRLLRTIAACWFEAAQPPCSVEERDNLLDALGRAGAPRIWIPKASFSELPYYQPVTKEVQRNIGGKKVSLREGNSRVLHFDHFAVVASPDIFFEFAIDLASEQRCFLSRLLAGARYFGRAESRAMFELVESGWRAPNTLYEAKKSGAQKPGTERIVRDVLTTANDFKACDLWQVRRTSGGKAKPRTKPESQPTGGDDHPPHLVEALIDARKPVPDGTGWVRYAVPRAAVVHELSRHHCTPQPSGSKPAAEVVFRMFRRVPIPVLQTVSIARDFRDQAVHAYEAATGQSCVLLSGRESDGTVAKGNRHAYYLPQPARAGGFLERLVVRLPGGENGVDQEILDALLGVTRLLQRHEYPVLVVQEELRTSITSPTARCWRSLTPFLGTLRHRQRRAKTEPVQQLVSTMLRSAGVTLQHVGAIRVLPVLSHVYGRSGEMGSRGFRLSRRAGFSFDLVFTDPVQLPFAAGHDAHFGLGQFSPTEVLT